MYSLDVNFLKDRGIQSDPGLNKPRPTPKGAMTPLYIGVGVGLFFPAVVVGLLFFLQQQTAQLQSRSQELDQQLGELKKAEDQIAQLNKQIAQVNDETTALATVFNQIKPWSALLQDIREDIPPGVQIKTIQQQEVPLKNPPPAANAANAKPAAAKGPNNAKGANPPANAAPPTVTQMQISGTARSFDDVGYFLLTLQRSPFLKKDDTQLVKAQLVNNPTRIETPENKARSAVRETYELPKLVEYTIQTSLSDVPASDMLRELDRKGAVGLVTRIRNLQQIQQKGVNQP